MTSTKTIIKASNAEEFCLGVMPSAELSLALCQIAEGRLRQANTVEFVGLELEEANTVISLLKGLGIPDSAIDDKARETLERVEKSADGAEFDLNFIKAQLKHHQGLYELADNYLSTPVDASDAAEMQGRRLATLARFAFKEHVILCTRISRELQ